MDIKTVASLETHFDLQMSAGVLEQENGMRTAILLSVFTDAPGKVDGEVYEGWWGNGLTTDGDVLGSELWQFTRSKRSTETLRKLEDGVRKALQWVISDGLSRQVAVSAEWHNEGALLKIVLDSETVRLEV